MTLSDALALAQENQRRTEAAPFHIRLIAGSTANPLQLFVTACAARRLPDRRIVCALGGYGDLVGALAEPAASDVHVVMVVVEWPDLDPRLGLRRFAVATPEVGADMLDTVSGRLAQIAGRIARLAEATPVVLALPSLEPPPVFLVPGARLGRAEAALRGRVFEFAERCLELSTVKIVHPARLDSLVPPPARRSATGELGADMPYPAPHMAALAQGLVEAAAPPPRLKGLITDLDDTLWKGLVGEIGAENVSWAQEDQAQMHGVYQQMLNGLAGQGVLLAVVSRNAPEFATPALERADLRLAKDSLYPIEIGWEAKSAAVARVLSAWNVGPDAVAFVDDSQMELAEVQARFPQMTAWRFPADDEGAALELIQRIRDRFSRDSVSEDDRLRLASLRRAPPAPGEFLAGLKARLSFDFQPDAREPRALELVNKTNQFNINGRRIEAADWARGLQDRRRFAVTVAYEDRFGPLGTVSVAAGEIDGGVATLQTWVLSCRAFARRIEHVVLEVLKDRLGVERLAIDYAPSEKNAPLRAFLREIGAEPPDGPGVVALPELPPTQLHERVFREPK